MSDPRDAMVEKFRANLRARVQKLRDMLEILGSVADSPEAMSQVAGELHTLKGEARLLGLVPLSELAHALESILLQVNESTLTAADVALTAMFRALQDGVPRQDADALLVATLHRVTDTSASLEAADSPPVEQSSDASSTDPNPIVPALVDAGRWVQVDSQLVNALCDAMAAVSGDFGRIFAQVSNLVSTAKSSATFDGGRQQGALLVEECARFRTALDNATVRTWELRMVPAQPLLRELGAHAEQLAEAAGKVVNVKVDAAGVQIERDALDKVWDAMIHLVRNAVDHGLERADERGVKGSVGHLSITARTVGSSVTLTVADDGRGIDAERVRRAALTQRVLDATRAESMTDDEVVQLVFEHGFSTRDTVSETSGRGVGLDVVKARVESLGGRIEIQTKVGAGTRFSLTLPFTLTKERLMVFEFAGGLYGLPTRTIHEVIGWRELREAEKTSARAVRVGGELVPIRSLAELLGREPEPSSAALVVTLQAQRYALLVSRIVGERELIRRPAEPLLARTTAIGASAMLEDGRAVLMLDLTQVARHLRRVGGTGASSSTSLVPNVVRTVLLVDDSPVIREMVSEILVSAGLKVVMACDGQEALEKLSEAEPDLVVSDVEMPRLDGFGLLEQIRRRTQRLPVVMLTTRASVQDRQRASTLGANAYVLKADFKSDVLLDVVQRFVPLHR